MARFDILFFDLDGTLLGPDHIAVSPRNREALSAAACAGVRLAFATGRCLAMIPRENVGTPFDYAVTSNGVAIHDLRADQMLYRRAFTPEEARLACRATAQCVDFFELFVDGRIRLTDSDFARVDTRPLPIWHVDYFARHHDPSLGTLEDYLAAGAPGLEKINLNMCDPAALVRLRDLLAPSGLFEITTSAGAGVLEVVPRGCTKGAAIRRLCDHLGVDPARAAALGDGGNDIEMLKTVGCGVAMGNANEAVRAAADIVTDAYDRDGVARFIEQYVL